MSYSPFEAKGSFFFNHDVFYVNSKKMFMVTNALGEKKVRKKMEILFVSIGELLLWGGCNLTLYKKGHWTEGQAAGHFHFKDAIKRPRGSSPSSPLANKIFSSLIYDIFLCQNSLARRSLIHFPRNTSSFCGVWGGLQFMQLEDFWVMRSHLVATYQRFFIEVINHSRAFTPGWDKWGKVAVIANCGLSRLQWENLVSQTPCLLINRPLQKP